MNPETQTRLLRGETFDCDCCGQRVKAYQYGINPQMLHQLRLLGGAWPETLHARDLQVSTSGLWRKYSFLRFWGLAENPQGADWKITDFGRSFLRGEVAVPRYVYLFNNECVRTSIERTRVGGLVEWGAGSAADTDETHAQFMPELQPVASD